jgi:hypothetical protein
MFVAAEEREDVAFADRFIRCGRDVRDDCAGGIASSFDRD